MIESHNTSVMVVISRLINIDQSITQSNIENLWKIKKMKRWVVDNNKQISTILIDYNIKTNTY